MDGERLVDRAVRVLARGGCDPIWVVLGAWVGDVPGARSVINEDWPQGMGSSLAAGIRAIADDQECADVDTIIVTLVDLPGLTDAAVARVGNAGSLAAATFGGVRGHPVAIGREHWAGVLRTAVGDRGARDYLRERSDITLVEVGDVADGSDLDFPSP